MPPQSAPSGTLFPPAMEKKTPGSSGHVGTPTESLRRVVKPLGNHNRPRTLSPAFASPLREKSSFRDKKTPLRAKKVMPTGVDLTQRFADSIHGPCSLATNRAADIRSPGVTSPLDRIREECSMPQGRERKGTAGKSRLRGDRDDTAVKKAITFPASLQKDSLRKKLRSRRKELEEHFRLKVKEEDGSFSSGTLQSRTKTFVERRMAADTDFASNKHDTVVVTQLEEDHAKLVPNDLRILWGVVEKELAVVAADLEHTPGKLVHRGYVWKEGRSHRRIASDPISFDALMPSLQPSRSFRFQKWGVGLGDGGGFGAAAVMEPHQDALASELSHDVTYVEEFNETPSVASPLPSKSPEFRKTGVHLKPGEAEELHDDVLDEKWFRSRDLTCLESNDDVSLMPSLQPSKSPEFKRWGGGTGGSFGVETLAEARSHIYSVTCIDEGDDAPLVKSPQPFKSPEFKIMGARLEGGATAECQDDVVDEEWFRSRDLTYLDANCEGNSTPSPQPSKTPELKRWGAGHGGTGGSFVEGAAVNDRQREDASNQGTPPPQPTNSPEFLKRGSVPPTGGGCFAAGPIMGPGGMQSVKDRRKCKPRGILTIGGDFLSSSGSAEFDDEVELRQMISVPAMASVEWMVTECCDAEPLGLLRSSGGRDQMHLVDVDASLKISPGSLSRYLDRESSPSGDEDDVTDRVFWQNELLEEWSRMPVTEARAPSFHKIAQSDQKRRGATFVREEAATASCGKLRDSSSECAQPSRWATLTGSLTADCTFGTPPHHTASNPAGDGVLHSTSEVDNFPTKFEGHRHDSMLDVFSKDDHDAGFVKQLLPVDKVLEQLSLVDSPAPSSSMTFSVDSTPDSCGFWQGMRASQSTGWSSRCGGSWHEFLGSSQDGSIDHQFQFPLRKDENPSYATTPTDENFDVDTVKGISPSTTTVSYSDGSHSATCTPSSDEADSWHPQICNCESPDDMNTLLQVPF